LPPLNFLRRENEKSPAGDGAQGNRQPMSSELPAERPTRFQLVANLKTAKLIGITLPSSILLRADEVIE
jgi:hypothetical protein